MIFSSTVFLFVFLPVTLALYYLLSARYRNLLLLAASLVFYAWGEPVYVVLMILSIIFNWAIGIFMSVMPGRRSEFAVLSTGVVINLLVLAHYKYAHFLISSFNGISGWLIHRTFATQPVPLPIGISFFTFHAISYIVDIYRRQAQALKSPLDMGLYISMFPQLVAGPIIRYHDVADQLLHRTNNLERFSSGIERFVFGLGKKILLANALGQIADQAFNTPAASLSAADAWLGIICYTLQIYFDFSGYSDMAIGLARLFGFELTENFNYPYIAGSIREFWRRWHLSLSTWFRDYVYIPLGGNRGSSFRVRINLFTVFFLCGLWHGASWNFAFWGVFHGGLLVLERGRFGAVVDRVPRWLSSTYTMLMVMVGWVFFRADTFRAAIAYLHAMFFGGIGRGFTPQIYAYLGGQGITTIIMGIVLSTPLFVSMSRDWNQRRFPDHAKLPLPDWATRISFDGVKMTAQFVRCIIAASIMILSVSSLAMNTYNPFIYFRF